VADLVTLAAIKAYMGITGTELDATLAAQITRVSAAIEGYLQTNVLAASFEEKRNGYGGTAIQLYRKPVQSVQALVINGQAVQAATAFGQPGWWLSGRLLLLVGCTYAKGWGNVDVTYTAGYTTVPADIEQACLEAIALATKRKDHIDVSSKSLGGETISYITSNMTPSALTMLNRYRIVGL
jgi:hypothetical protein